MSTLGSNAALPDLSSIMYQGTTQMDSAAVDTDNLSEIPLSTEVHPNEAKSQSIDPDRECELRIILTLYYHKFKDDLRALSNDLETNLANKNLHELEDLRRKCDLILGASSACDNKKKFFNSMIYFIESMGNKAGMKLNGLTATLVKDEDFQRDLCRLSLKYLSSKETLPEVTVGMRLFTTITQINYHNETIGTAASLACTNTEAISAPPQGAVHKDHPKSAIIKKSSDAVSGINLNYTDL